MTSVPQSVAVPDGDPWKQAKRTKPDEKNDLSQMRTQEEIALSFLAQVAERVDHRSYARQSVEMEPTVKLGHASAAIERRVSRQTLYDIPAEKQDVTPTIALPIGKLTGTTAEMWVNMQRNYDLRVQSVKDAEVLARIPTLEAA
jgi:addiction module HigA family antidote